VPVPLSQLALKLFVNPKPGSELKVPGLVWEAPTSSLTDSGHWEMTDAGNTMNRPRAGEPIVFLVEKTAGTNNPFAMGVTVGRVETNDVIVDDGSVSRFHAWLQQDGRTQQWALTDAESKNGTWVDGVKVDAKKRIPLVDGAKLKFGDVEMGFYLATSLTGFVNDRFNSKK
jgi:hypothetical protein